MEYHMYDQSVTYDDLIEEISILKQRNQELEQAEKERKQTEETLRESERRYRELSIVDELTHLYNPRHFYAQLKNEIDRANRYEHPLTLLLLDLDDFKQFNDNYGHMEGDQVLSRLGQVVKQCMRQTDSAYRYGGEEFTILLPMTTSADGIVTAERIRTEFEKETFSPVPDQNVHVTVSIGLTQYKPREDAKVFVQRADQLMYQAKRTGKNRVCFQPSQFITMREYQSNNQVMTYHEFIEEIAILKQSNLELEESGAARQRAEEALRTSLGQLYRAMQTTVQVLASVMEVKDPYTAEHQKRTTDLALAICTGMCLSPEQIEGIRMGGVIHDIGKIALPTEILSKPTKLNSVEFSLIKEHARQGYEILKDVEFPMGACGDGPPAS